MPYPTAQNTRVTMPQMPRIAHVTAGPNLTRTAQDNYRQIPSQNSGWRDQQVIEDNRSASATRQKAEAYKAMADNPQNASMIAQGYGIPMTPELQQMLKQPQMLKNVATAADWVSKMQIKNPEVANKLMMEAAQQGMAGQPFNPVEVFGSVQGMDMGQQMSEYDQARIGLARQRAGRGEARDTRGAAGGGGAQAQNAPLATQVLDNAIFGPQGSSAPPGMSPDELEATNWAGKAKKGDLDIENPAYMAYAAKYRGGASAGGTPAAPAGKSPRFESTWGD